MGLFACGQFSSGGEICVQRQVRVAQADRVTVDKEEATFANRLLPGDNGEKRFEIKTKFGSLNKQ